MSNDKNSNSLFQIIVGVSSIVACIAAVLVVPEFRRWSGLDTPMSTQTTEPATAPETITPTMMTIETPFIIPTSTSPNTSAQIISQHDLDSSVGTGNWECVYGYKDSIIINEIPPNFIVKFPFKEIYDYKISEHYYTNDIVPNKIIAIASLEGSLPENFSCPPEHTKITSKSLFYIMTIANPIRSGIPNWECIPNNYRAVKAYNIPPFFYVNGAIAFAEEEDGYIVEKGNRLGQGTATIWFEYEILSGECQ